MFLDRWSHNRLIQGTTELSIYITILAYRFMVRHGVPFN